MFLSPRVRHDDAVSAVDLPIAERTCRVLVVDDDTKLARILAAWLEDAGFSCSIAESGDQALWAMNDGGVDALVLDVMIPHPSGVEVCRHLRAGGFAGAIVMISARSNPDDQEATSRAGADRFLAKPFALDLLVTTLREALGR
jgi:DNA-binding response OmpR family regulator